MAGKNTEIKIIAPKQIFPEIKGLIDTSVSFNQGDLLILDAANDVVRAPTAEAEAQYLLGVAQIDIVDGLIRSPYQGTAVDAAQAGIAVNGPVYGNSYKMVLKTGDSLAIGDYVYAYPAGGANYVAATGTKPVGLYIGQVDIASAAAGTQIECLIGARFPNDAIKF